MWGWGYYRTGRRTAGMVWGTEVAVPTEVVSSAQPQSWGHRPRPAAALPTLAGGHLPCPLGVRLACPRLASLNGAEFPHPSPWPKAQGPISLTLLKLLFGIPLQPVSGAPPCLTILEPRPLWPAQPHGGPGGRSCRGQATGRSRMGAEWEVPFSWQGRPSPQHSVLVPSGG